MSIKMRRNKLAILTLWSGTVIALLADSCKSEGQLTYARYYTNGKELYDIHCQNCHNSDGKGLQSLIPPLTDSAFLRKNKSKLACIIKYGLTTPVVVNGKTYDSQMPENSQLPDIDIAALVTYITNSFGNNQGLYDAEEATKDLKNCAP